ncbi:MAG: acetyltransferase, ribosomal protein N-acetylase [Bacteroidetes bacterium]|nr:acetyltransferase, ribosomal protein N-acetylase [Bacteroidota bacterium]
MKLKSEFITLRAIEPADIDVLYNWENDTDNWKVSSTQTPFSRFVLEQYITSAHEDLYTAKQLRLMIDTIVPAGEEVRAVGSIDLFDFDPNHLRVGIGILIADKSDRKKGYASETLKLLVEYCFTSLNLKQVYCNITIDNEPSILLFQKHGFQITGIKKQWIRDGAVFKDELLLQRIR